MKFVKKLACVEESKCSSAEAIILVSNDTSIKVVQSGDYVRTPYSIDTEDDIKEVQLVSGKVYNITVDTCYDFLQGFEIDKINGAKDINELINFIGESCAILYIPKNEIE